MPVFVTVSCHSLAGGSWVMMEQGLVLAETQPSKGTVGHDNECPRMA